MPLSTNAQKINLTAKLFRGFSDTSRLAILETLRDGAMTVGEIVAETELTQSNVSNHLGCLRDCGLVTAEQDGRFVYYALSDKRVERFLNLAEELLREVARGVYECVHYEKPVRNARRNVPVARRKSQKERNGVRSVRDMSSARRRKR